MSGSENETYRQRKEKGGLAPDCSAKNASMKNSIFFALSVLLPSLQALQKAALSDRI